MKLKPLSSLVLLLATASLVACGSPSSKTNPSSASSSSQTSQTARESSSSSRESKTSSSSQPSDSQPSETSSSYSPSLAPPSTTSPTTQSSTLPPGAVAEGGLHTVSQVTPILDQPHLGRAPLDHYEAGETVTYYAKLDQDGQTWLLIHDDSGQTRYVPLNWPGEASAEYQEAQAVAGDELYEGTYTVLVQTPVYASPFVDQSPVAVYEAGATLDYQGKLEMGGQTWLYLLQADGTAVYVPIAPSSAPLAEADVQD